MIFDIPNYNPGYSEVCCLGGELVLAPAWSSSSRCWSSAAAAGPAQLPDPARHRCTLTKTVIENKNSFFGSPAGLKFSGQNFQQLMQNN